MRLSDLGEVGIRLAREKGWGLSRAIGHVPRLRKLSSHKRLLETSKGTDGDQQDPCDHLNRNIGSWAHSSFRSRLLD